MNKLSLSDKTFVVTLADTFKYLITLLLGVSLARLFNKEMYGTYQQGFLVVWTLIAFLNFGLPSSIYYFFPTISSDDKKVLTRQTLILLFLISLIAYIILYTISEFISIRFHNQQLEHLLKIFGLYIIPMTTLGCFGPIMISINKSKILALYTVITNSIFCIMIFLLAFIRCNLQIILPLIVTFAFINLSFAIWYINKQIGIFNSFSYNSKLLISQIKYAAPIGFSGMVGYLGKQIDKFVMAMFFSVSTYAVYNVGAIEIPFITILTANIDSISLPEIVKFYKNSQKQELLKLWHEMIRKTSLIIFPLFVYCFLLAPQIITLLYSENYRDAYLIFRIYLLIILFRIARFSIILQAIGKTKLIFVGAVLYLLLNTILNMALTRILGFSGPAWATFIGILLLVICYTAMVKISMGLHISELYPWKSIRDTFASSFIAGACIYPLVWLKWPNLIIVGLSGIIYLFLCLALMYKINVLKDHDFDLIKRLIKLKQNYKQ